MPLPKIEHPIHTVFLKSLNKEVRFRPFLVKEEKLLLIAKESGESTDIRNTIIQILQNCCIDDIDVQKLPLFDVEMFFIHLRMKSIGETTKLQFTCENIIEESQEVCGYVTDYDFNLNNVRYEADNNISDTVKLGNDIGIKLRYPTVALFAEYDNPVESAIRAVIDNIDYIYDADSVYKREDVSDEELVNFLDELSVEQVDQIRQFFNNFPKVVLEDSVSCNKCGFNHNIKAENLYSFFL
jgi:hypothetical protein